MNAELWVARGCCLIPTLNPSRVDLSLNVHTSQSFCDLIGPTTLNTIAIRHHQLAIRLSVAAEHQVLQRAGIDGQRDGAWDVVMLKLP
jgi:hypothetical protein